MMRILICSDSHGLTAELEQLKKAHSDVDIFIHCGDSELPSNHPAIFGFEVVKGNCDFGPDFSNERLIEAGDHRIFVTHGHMDHVKFTLMNLKYKAEEMQADIVCYGHTHVLAAETADGILFLNPGSIRLPKFRKEKTYLLLELTDTEKIVHVYELGAGKLLTERFS